MSCGLRYAELSVDDGRAMIVDVGHRASQLCRPVTTAALRTRPAPEVWSALEYLCHLRDVQAWYQRWEAGGYFRHRDHQTPAYCIQLPPPNVTGTLHMGHAFQQTLMDTLIRYHRMRGDNTNWVVGTDHAGIATEIVVERQLQAQGKARTTSAAKSSIERVWQWKQQSGSTITRQMRRLGASANWEYADTEGQKGGYFTMDAKMSRAVVEVFVRLVRGRPHLPRQEPGQLGPGAAHRGVGPRSRQRGRRRHDVADPLPVRRRPAASRTRTASRSRCAA